MKIRFIALLTALFVAIFIGIASFQPDGFVAVKDAPPESDKESLIMHALLGGLKQMHYEPQEINDDLSAKAFDLYMQRIDGAKRFFIQSEVDKMREYRLEMDDQAKNGEFDLFELSIEMLDESVERTQEYYRGILARPFDFEKDETVELDQDKRDFVNTHEQLKDRWKKLLKYEALSRVYSKMEAQEKKLEKAEESTEEEGEKFEPNTREEIEAEVREDILKDYDRWYKRLKEMRREDRLNNYLNSITNVFDPHTGYFQPKEKESFDINLSGTLEGIGARLSQKDDHVKIVEVIPGGPAWKQKELEANDLIIAVAQGDDKPVNIVGWRVDDAVELIRGKKGSIVNLTVEKADGTQQIISIVRDVVIIDENYAKSTMLQMPEVSGKIGYLKLPSFYADFNRQGGRSSAKDVGIEIEKLKKEGAEGIILDLRFNTGGSLRDAVDMTGLFIDEGPVVQVKDRIRPTRIYRDTDKRTQYDGPLIVLVNNFSASASEILAAALQDYGRAVIVGSKSTYGKGTVQQFLNLDRALQGFDEHKPLGSVKMTIQKFYRIDGGSTQLRGVESDIVIPDKYMLMTVGEKENDHPLEWTSIDKANYSTTRNSEVHEYLGTLESRSNKRVQNNETFQLVEQNALRLKKNEDLSNLLLNWSDYKTLRETQKEEADRFNDIFKVQEELEVMGLEADKDYLALDESRQARYDDWVKSIKKDAYIVESMRIMQDMFTLSGKVAKGK